MILGKGGLAQILQKQLLENLRLILTMSAENGPETTTYCQLATKNVSAFALAETTYEWSNQVLSRKMSVIALAETACDWTNTVT